MLEEVHMSDLSDDELKLALNGECSTVEVIVWLAREVKRYRDAGAAMQHDGQNTVKREERNVVPGDVQGAGQNTGQDDWQLDVQDDERPVVSGKKALGTSLVFLSGNAPLEIFPFVTILHREVVLRHKDGGSQDIELTPDEADRVAVRLQAAAAAARGPKIAP